MQIQKRKNMNDVEMIMTIEEAILLRKLLGAITYNDIEDMSKRQCVLREQDVEAAQQFLTSAHAKLYKLFPLREKNK